MSTENILYERSGSGCELCTSKQGLSVYEIPPSSDGSADQSILICETCRTQIENPETMDKNHWRCLSNSMWSEYPAIQVMAWRVLNQLSDETWAQDLLGQLYLEDDVRMWAEALNTEDDSSDQTITKDSNGAPLSDGDSVTLIKDLVVKGANFTAKRGTIVRNITLTSDPKYIEGKINGTQIVLVAAFLKKA